MISIEALVQAIQGSVLAASDALFQRNLDLLDQYFERVDDDEEAIESMVQTALAASAETAGTKDSEQVRDKVRQAAEALRDVARGLQKDDDGRILVPKLVPMQYPYMTPDGPKVHVVYVPLVTLVPVSSAQVSEVRFKTELTLNTIHDAIRVGFPTRRQQTTEDGQRLDTRVEVEEPDGAPASLEIIVRAEPPSAGLQLVIEGYDRALRAQIPG